VILTMTMVMMTSLAMTRERERGTMENLLATPARPIEVMIGKIVPYILIGYVQVTVILVAAWLLFDVPMVGSLALLSAVLSCSSRPTSRSASRSRRSRATSCRRCS
jgi:ABC-2 type transport system permease protein